MFEILLLILAIVCIAAAGYCYTRAYQSKRLYWTDWATPILAVVFWFVLTANGIGNQSLSHLVEIPISLVLALGLFYLRLDLLDDLSSAYRINSWVYLLVTLLAVLLLRLYMPYIAQ